MKLKHLTLLTIAGAALAPQANAAFTFVPTPEGSHAGWDTFLSSTIYPTITITNDAPDQSNTSNFSATLSASMGGSASGSGQRLYNGTAATSAAFNVTINGTAGNAISQLTLALKTSKPDDATGIAYEDFFSASLNGASAIASELFWNTTEVIGTAQNARPVAVVYFEWTGLSINPSDTFNIALTSPALGHVSLDTIQLSEAVPEPSAALLSAMGSLTLLRRRR